MPHLPTGDDAAADDADASTTHPFWSRILDLLPDAIARRPVAGNPQTLAGRLRAVTRPGGPLFLQPQPDQLRPLEKESRALTVVSANLWHDWPQHRRQEERLEQFARLVESENVDVALLQEVSRRPDLHADEWLAERLGMAYAYARANGHRGAIGFEEGLAIFSRFPLRDAALRHLSGGRASFTRRLALTASLDTPFGALDVFSVHLGLLPWHNADQVDRLLAWVGGRTSDRRPAIVGGDFNAHEDAPQLLRARNRWLDLFRHHHPEKDGTTYQWTSPLGTPHLRRRLDYLFMVQNGHDWRVLDVRHLDAAAADHSDHRAVLAHLSP